MNDEAIKNIEWWVNCPLFLPSAPTSDPIPNITLSTDASSYGFGGALSEGPTVSGSWSQKESNFHINYLELKAIKLCILSFINYLKNNTVKIC